ncbi:MAG TPA: protein-L-isoaspartate(D-aspartate) O-methyltransferase [Kofleriaceae bacterium]|nr:protein-L-isoaspartate(D-aspartate) O-methyltransferase [Kofleriaceae bacterium]
MDRESEPAEHDQQRAMVDHIAVYVRDRRVLEVMGAVPRHPFVPEPARASAYRDQPLPIGHGQTISQPLMVAIMLEALELRGDERVLDVGTGSGYQAALLGRLAREVWSIEIVPELAERARATLARAGADNVHVISGDGSMGWSRAAPYDAIVAAAASPHVPPPLLAQLAEGGRLVLPVGDRMPQELMRLRRRGGHIHREDLGACTFVPLVGEHGVSRPQWESMQLATAMAICVRAEEALDRAGPGLSADELHRITTSIRQTRAAAAEHDAELARDRAAILSSWLDERVGRWR